MERRVFPQLLWTFGSDYLLQYEKCIPRMLLRVYKNDFYFNNILTAAMTISDLAICDCIIVTDNCTSTFLNDVLELCILAFYTLFVYLLCF